MKPNEFLNMVIGLCVSMAVFSLLSHLLTQNASVLELKTRIEALETQLATKP